MLPDLNRIATEFAKDTNIEANASITFETILTTAGFTLDDWGNPIPEEEDKRITTLECYLREKPMSRSDLKMYEGIDQNCTFFKGRLVNPREYPMPIKSNSPMSVTVNGRSGTAIGDIRLFETPFSQQKNIKIILGQRIGVMVQFTQGQ